MICCICGQDLPEESFYPSELKGHRKPRCRECHKKKKNEKKKKRGEGVMYVNGRLSVCKEHSTSIYWSGNMISTLKRHFPTTKNAELADLLGVSPRTISRKAKELGLVKDEAWMVEVATENGIYGKVTKARKLKEIENRKNNGKHNELVCI